MKTTMKNVFLGFLFAMLLSSSGVFGQEKALAELQAELVSPWLVTVEGENRTRILRITGLTQKADGVFHVEAVYGFSDENQTPITAEMSQNKLVLTTQANTKIVVTQKSGETFAGTFTLKNGTTNGVTLARVSENELSAKVASEQIARAEAIIIKPAADVPTTCAALSGVWTGTWPTVGQVWLWVAEVDAKCVAKYSYGISAKVPTAFKTAEIKNGILQFGRPGGTASFELRGGELLGRYVGSLGDNNATLQKVQLLDGSLTKLRAEQAATEAVTRNVTPPAADVPASCAAFFGGWTGTWSQGNFGPQWLRVFAVEANCVAKLSYTNSENVPNVFITTEIKDGVLSFVCNSSTGGTCVFKRDKDVLQGTYSNPAGGRNNATFKKIE